MSERTIALIKFLSLFNTVMHEGELFSERTRERGLSLKYFNLALLEYFWREGSGT